MENFYFGRLGIILSNLFTGACIWYYVKRSGYRIRFIQPF